MSRGDDAVGADLGVVAHPAQQPVGDAGRAARAAGDLVRAVGFESHVEQPRRAGQHLLQFGGVVEVHVPGEPEAVAQRAGEQTGAGGGADQRERSELERDRRCARPLADDHVDPEVLHRQVEQLLGRAGDAVDLVDEQHLAIGEAGQQCGEIAGPLDGRTAGDPDRRAELGGDDHGEAGLAEPGWPGEQHVVRRPGALQGALQHQLELLAHLRLADELGQPLRAQRRLDLALLLDRQRRRRGPRPARSPDTPARPPGEWCVTPRVARYNAPLDGFRTTRGGVGVSHRARPSSWMLRRSSAGTSGWTAPMSSGATRRLRRRPHR